MTFLPERTAKPPIHVRFAEPEDAKAISQLYVHTYRPHRGGEAREHYPFPQIMQEGKVIDLMTGGTVIWVVAESLEGKIAGSAAAVRNIGGQQDRIAEIFGVAVEPTYQRRGLGSALLQKLHNELRNIAEVILCEARTAEAGGWKAARNAGFKPVGFEPYAHAMPIGFESMVLTASWNWERGADPSQLGSAQNTTASRNLAGIVFAPSVSASSSISDSPLARPEMSSREEILPGSVNVRRDDHIGQAWFADPACAFNRQFALVEFCPLEGAEPGSSRFEHAYYVASTNTSDIAAARVFYDRTDARARILGLRGETGRIELPFIEGIVENLLLLSRDQPLVIVLCVRVGTPALQTRLEAMGFFPTAYFPGMILMPTGRADVIQYTLLLRRSWPESIRSVTALEWPEARRVIDQVLQFHVNP